MHYFDSHAHIDIAAAGDPLRLAALQRRALDAGIRAILVPAVDPDHWTRIENLCPDKTKSTTLQPYPGTREIGQKVPLELYFALGIHPYVVAHRDDAELERAILKLDERLQSRTARLVAIGECGLDYRHATDSHARDRQLKIFRAQLELANQRDLPLVIHCVHAYGPLIETLRDLAAPPSIIHGFSGSVELARQLCAFGHFIGIGGVITRPNLRKLREALPSIPIEQLLLETDSPDQTPHSLRPLPNEPAFLPVIAQELAQMLKLPLASLVEQCTRNSYRAFRLPIPDA